MSEIENKNDKEQKKELTKKQKTLIDIIVKCLSLIIICFSGGGAYVYEKEKSEILNPKTKNIITKLLLILISLFIIYYLIFVK